MDHQVQLCLFADDTITYNDHRFITGQRVTYNDGGGTAIAPLSDGVYYIIKNDKNTIKLATSISNALASVPVNLANPWCWIITYTECCI